jgi:hypothetical protein
MFITTLIIIKPIPTHSLGIKPPPPQITTPRSYQDVRIARAPSAVKEIAHLAFVRSNRRYAIHVFAFESVALVREVLESLAIAPFHVDADEYVAWC